MKLVKGLANDKGNALALLARLVALLGKRHLEVRPSSRNVKMQIYLGNKTLLAKLPGAEHNGQ